MTDPANRKITVYEKLKKIKQNDKQTVRDLRSAIELFKQNIKSRSQKKKAYALFTAFKPSLKREVLRELRDMIAFREKIISVAKRYEEQATA
jgi:pyrroline-5-carboxylate reductase